MPDNISVKILLRFQRIHFIFIVHCSPELNLHLKRSLRRCMKLSQSDKIMTTISRRWVREVGCLL